MEMDHTDDLIVPVEYGHRDDAVRLHAVNHRAPELEERLVDVAAK